MYDSLEQVSHALPNGMASDGSALYTKDLGEIQPKNGKALLNKSSYGVSVVGPECFGRFML